MGCCQTRDSNEIQLFTPRDQNQLQNQLTFGGGKSSLNTKNSYKSNYNSNNFQRNTFGNAANSSSNRYPEEGTAGGNPFNVSFGGIKDDEIKINDTNSNPSFNLPNASSKMEEEKFFKEEEKNFEEDCMKAKKAKLFEKMDKLQIEGNNNIEENISGFAKTKNSQPILNHEKSNDSGYKSDLEVRLAKSAVKKNRYRPIKQSSAILDKVKILEDHLNPKDEEITDPSNIDIYTQIIMDKPIQSKKKISKSYNFLLSPQ